MKNYLLPFLFLFLIACEKEDDTIPTNDDLVSDIPAKECLAVEEYLLSDLDSSKEVYQKYFYDADRLVKVTYPLAQSVGSSAAVDSTLFFYDSNYNPAYSMNASAGVLDTVEKYQYDEEERLVEVAFYANGNPYAWERIFYEGLTPSKIIYESNPFIYEYEVRIENGSITELIQLSRNGNPVDSNYLRQRMAYDNQTNPRQKLHTGSYNRLQHFNKNNLTKYRLLRNGVVDQTQSIDYSYEYDRLGNPIRSIRIFSGDSSITYTSYTCQ